jgi:para-nitrobenzyl esterase
MSSRFSRRNLDCYLTVADELLRFRRTPIIHKFLRYTLSKVFYTGHLIPPRDKPAIFWRALRSGYLKYIGIKPEELGKLKDMDIESIHVANRELRELVFREGNSNCAFSPVIDGTVIKGHPADLAKQSNKPILIGTCSQEGDAFICNIPTVALPLAAYWFKFKFVPGKNSRRRMSDDFTKTFYTDPSREIAREIKGPSWVYEYQYMTPDIEKRGAGCFHASELPVLFGKSSSYANVDDPVSQRVGEKMREIWSAFAYNGVVSWAEYKDGGEVFAIK